jgi:hypothetical protein
MNTIEWRPVTGHEGLYEVSSDGQVRSVDRAVRHSSGGGTYVLHGRVLKPQASGNGYLVVKLSRDGKALTRNIHTLVLEAFSGPCPPGMEACHGDGDRANPALSNLRWDTRSANALDRVRHGNHNYASKTHCPQGHPYEGGNLRVRRNASGGPHRECRTCQRIRLSGLICCRDDAL